MGFRRKVPYRCIASHTFTDEKVSRLSPNAKLALLFIMQGPMTTAAPGLYPCNSGMVAGWVGCSIEAACAALDELVATGMMQFDGAVAYFPNWTRYYLPDNERELKGWANGLRLVPKGDLYEYWLDDLQTWYDEEARLGRRNEFRNVFGDRDIRYPGGRVCQTKAIQGEGEGEGEEGGGSESSTSSESSGTSVPSLPSAAPAAQPMLLRDADNAKRVFADWVTENEAKAVALGCPPGLFEAMALRCMEEFQHYYDTTTSNGRMTNNRILKFVKRVRRVDPLLVMQGMELYIDAHGGKKPWEYCAKIITNQTALSEKERNRDLDRHRTRYREGVWNEAITNLAENRATHGHEQLHDH